MSGNSSVHGVSADSTIENGKNKWIPIRVRDDGSLAVNTGGYGASHNRLIPAAATTHPGDDTNNAATWTEAENVTSLTITATIVTTGAAVETTNEYMFITIDAPNGTVAASFLGASAFSIDGDVQVLKVPLNQRVEINATSAIRRLDVQPTSICHVLVEAQ